MISIASARSSAVKSTRSSSWRPCRSNGGGLVGNGCVGDDFSPGTFDCGTARSSIGQTGFPVTRSSTNTNPCLVTCATALEVISAYQKCVAETVQRFGGFVAKYMGDGVLVYFGYPQAHEDDAERAVRGGLELIAAVGGLKTHAPLQTRVGIATGLVVVGDLIGSGASQEQAIVGETPNLAARLQGVAEPNRVVIAESTRKLVGNLFELEDLGPQELKGVSGPVRAWVAVRPSPPRVALRLFTQAA